MARISRERLRKIAQQPLVVDVEAERLGGGIKVGAVDEERDALILVKMHV